VKLGRLGPERGELERGLEMRWRVSLEVEFALSCGVLCGNCRVVDCQFDRRRLDSAIAT
jgi:hypothetical protein